VDLLEDLRSREKSFKKFKRKVTVSWVDEEDGPYEERREDEGEGEGARSLVKKEDTHIPNPP
jgi:hypothetical protein